MSDLISREEAIEALDFEIVHMTGIPNDGKNIMNPFAQYNKGLEDGIKAIRTLPSAEPERKKGECTKINCPIQMNYISNDCDIKTCPYRTERKIGNGKKV